MTVGPEDRYRIQVSLQSVLDLSAADALAGLGLNRAELVAIDHTACQRIGGAVEWLEHDGLLRSIRRASPMASTLQSIQIGKGRTTSSEPSTLR